ncbi:MAG: universal stress protein [Deltaproteobacteria bacterium]|nr:universal stress protein [Deltaproteobacteria bacterium]
MIKEILVPHDGSDHSASALQYALSFAKALNADVTGLYVVDIVALEGPFLHDMSGSLGFEPYLNLSDKMRSALEARGALVLEGFVSECKKAGVGFKTQVSSGVVANEICGAARLSDLVVMGNRGVNAKFDYGLLGSVTEAVVHKSPVPVCVVPGVFRPVKNPLLAYDGSVGACQALRSSAEIVKRLSLPLTVLTVVAADAVAGEGEALLKEAEDYLKPYDIKAEFARAKGEAAEAIADYYKEHSHDLIFMGASSRSKLVKLALGSVAEQVLRSVDGPFFMQR